MAADYFFYFLHICCIEMSQIMMQIMYELENKRIIHQTRFGKKKYKLTKAVLAKASVMA